MMCTFVEVRGINYITTDFCQGLLTTIALFQKRVWSYAWDVMDDLSAVPQDSIIDCLLDRLQRGQIYTWVGTLLLAINPSGVISTENNYDLSRADEYDGVCRVTHKEVEPHIFAVAARAHYRIVQGIGKPRQVIVLNGETGAGKTFNANKALAFLTASTKNASSAGVQKRGAVCDIVQTISDACRLISAFTTAPTAKNEVSSRHVQLVWLEYKKGSICGAKISSYLLERDRVTRGYCNFQIFSQIMTALEDAEFAETGLSRDRRYYMLSDLDSLKGQQSSDSFQDTLKAMDMLGFARDQRRNVFQVLSLLIHMGNIQFVQEDDHCKLDTDSKQSKEALENTCKLARLEEEDITELLTSILINPQSSWRRHTMYRRNLSTNDACRYRLHSIIRHLYDLLFRWLLDSMNGILSVHSGDDNERLGILDIFGFECFDTNGIEQLCVNYVNERLQQYFVDKYLESCRKDLQEEGLIGNEQPSEIVQLYENRICTIEKQLFTTLNDTCQSIVPSNSAKLIQQITTNNYFVTRRFLSVRNENFAIQHYAGTVEYSIDDLLTKNTDKIPNEMIVTFSVSRNTFLYSLINGNKYHDEKLRMKKPTMLSKLRYNVDELIQELKKCDVHYVRCIKPRQLDNRNWDRCEFHKQLVNTGILDALPLARCKYPIHFSYKEFFERYCGKRAETCDLITACKKMLESSQLTTINDNNSSIHYGKRLIFLTNSIFLQLESARWQRHVECVKRIESFWLKCKRNKSQRTGGECMKNMQQSDKMHAPTDFKHIDVTRKDVSSQKDENEDDEVFISDNATNFFATANTILDNSDLKTYQQENVKRNMPNNAEVIFSANIQNKLLARNQVGIVQSIFGINVSQPKTVYAMCWLKNMIETTIIKTIESLIPEQLQLRRDCNQFIDIGCNNDTRLQHVRRMRSNNDIFRTKNGILHEMNSTDYNKEEDVYIIQSGSSTLFYRNRILSRRRLVEVPVRVHTRPTCLTNSHCLVYTQLPRGLQDCL